MDLRGGVLAVGGGGEGREIEDLDLPQGKGMKMIFISKCASSRFCNIKPRLDNYVLDTGGRCG